MAEKAIILTYHSISNGPGPTSISPATFAMQMETLAHCGYESGTLDQFLAWHAGTAELGRRVFITFDDAFADFAEQAMPIMAGHGFTALMFVPTRHVGGFENWYTSPPTERRLMRRDQILEAAEHGMEFGAHGRTHRALTELAPAEIEAEVAGSGADLARWLGRPIKAFAAPYGAVNAVVIEAIGNHYPVAFGTGFDKARQGEDRLDVPRIDMHYFRNRLVWRNFLEGGSLYFRTRQVLRRAGQAVRRAG